MTVRIVPETEWSHGDVSVCRPLRDGDEGALIEIRDRSNRADLVGTLVHEYGHALLHLGSDDTPNGRNEKSKPKRSPTSSSAISSSI